MDALRCRESEGESDAISCRSLRWLGVTGKDDAGLDGSGRTAGIGGTGGASVGLAFLSDKGRVRFDEDLSLLFALSAFIFAFSSFSFDFVSSLALASASRCACFSIVASLAVSARCLATFCASSFSAAFSAALASFASIFCDFFDVNAGATGTDTELRMEGSVLGSRLDRTEVELASGTGTAFSSGCC